MSRCKNCKIEILDPTDKCPFCNCVLENYDLDKEGMYPNASAVVKRFRFLENLFLFLSIMFETIFLVISYWLDTGYVWSIVAGLVLVYANVVFRLAIVGRSGYQFKICSLVFTAIAILIAIDYVTGYKGWSINFVLPSGILLIDLGILILMIINHRNWQSYLMLQILTILLALIPTVLLILQIVTFSYITVIALGASVFIFLGTLILGDQRARTELKRRFHV